MKLFRTHSLLFILVVFLQQCSKPPVYTNNEGKGSCGNGVQDRGEFGIDCGGTCPDICTTVRYLEGEIFSRIALNPYYQYIVTGPLIIRDKASIEIQAGTHIKIEPNVGAYIAITQGAQMFAWGTKENPIRISSNALEPEAADWGGIIICGQDSLLDAENKLSDLGFYYYGGDKPFDSSGYLNYLKIEHAGANYNDSLQFNALSFYGVGSYTNVNNVWIENSAANGIVIEGGSLNLTDIYVNTIGKDGLIIKDGWRGTGEFWTIHQTDRNGLVIDDYLDIDPSERNPFSLSNITIVDAQNYGLYFSQFNGVAAIDMILIRNSTIGFGHNENEFSNLNLTLSNISSSNNSLFSDALFFQNLPALMEENSDLETIQIPDWVESWPE